MNIKTHTAKLETPYRSKLDVISSIYNEWNPAELKRDGIIKSFLLNWSPVYFIWNLAYDNTLNHKGTEYEVKFYNCQLSDITKASKVALSFRECNELGINICLVKFIYSH